MSTIRETVEAEVGDEGMRLDKWLTEQLSALDYAVSRSQVQNWIATGKVTTPGRPIKSSEPVVAETVYEVDVFTGDRPRPEPEEMPLDIVYEDEDVVVVNKPRGLVVHPGAGHWNGTLVNGLLGKNIPLSDLGGSTRPGIVHRIDKDTSGLVVVAKTDRAYYSLVEQLRRHTVDRVYRAIAHGRIVHESGLIDAPIGRDSKHRQRMAVVDSGKRAVTHFRVMEWFLHYTDVSLSLETGRTHQVRVHLSHIGHPLAGDPVYGPRHTLDIAGQALHAGLLGFRHPVRGEHLAFEAPLPPDMQRLLDGLHSGVIGV